jgi:mono/diheme cytochrome c family protein
MRRVGRTLAFKALAFVALAFMALAAAAALPARAQQGRTLPQGDGRDLVAVACSQCHALNLIMSLRDGPAGWRQFVTNMVTRGAQLNPREADTVIAYLATNFGPTAPTAAAAAAAALPPGPGKELVATRCTLCHDLERVAGVNRAKAQWPDLVANMVGRGAPVSPDEAETIAAYLAANFGREAFP